MASPLTRLGELAVGRFMREYWQRRPVVLRSAVAPPPLDRARLFALAARADVESRLVVRNGRDWSLRHGPLPRRALPPVTRPGWTVLVQGVDGVDAAAGEFLQRFRFVPDARLDDLMASWASDGGGVGPHVDSYDVFLVQAAGWRRWRISRQRDLALRSGQPLRLLARFRAQREWLLGPGDVLYLPPGVAHDGVAEGGECITLSIGFRAPTWQELLDPWFAAFAERRAPPGRYADPGLRPTTHPGALPAAMVARVHAALSRARPRRADTERFLLERLSEPADPVVFTPAARPPAAAAFRREARRRGLRLEPRTRLLAGRSGIGINGEFVAVGPGAGRALLARLADHRELSGAELARAPAALLRRLREWRAAGWIRPGSGRGRARGPGRRNG